MRAARLTVLVVLVAVASCQFDSMLTLRMICRGDTTPARDSVSLVRCSTLDTLTTSRN